MYVPLICLPSLFYNNSLHLQYIMMINNDDQSLLRHNRGDDFRTCCTFSQPSNNVQEDEQHKINPKDEVYQNSTDDN